MSRRTGVVVAMLTVAMSLPMATAFGTANDPGTLYLTDEDFPKSTMTPVPPETGELPNFDPGRDLAPGLILERTDLGLFETDEAKHQQWQSDSKGYFINQVPTLFLWVATEGFDTSRSGAITAYLLECAVWGEDCEAIAAEHHSFQASRGEKWIEAQISFDQVEYEVPDGRVLAVRVVASLESEANVLLAYDRLDFRSRLAFASKPLAPVDELVPQALLAAVAEASEEVPPPPVSQPAPVDAEVDVAATQPEPLSWLVILGLSSLVVLLLGLVLLGTLGSGGQHRRDSGRPAWFSGLQKSGSGIGSRVR